MRDVADVLFALMAAVLFGLLVVPNITPESWWAKSAERITGKVSYVHDGDTLRIGRQRIRIHGIDSPELSTPQGLKARDWAVRAWEGKHAVCTPLGKSYNRIVARCQINSKDIGLQIIQSGHACEWRKYSKGFYRQRETCESKGQR